MTGDDTQNPNTEPGCPDVEPPIVIGIANSEGCELFTLTPGHPPHPPSGICLVGDGMSDVASSPPNGMSGEDQLRYERILAVSTKLLGDPWLIQRIENLLGLLALGANRDRVGAIAVALANRPGLIENAEELIQMGS